ncbi:MAG: glycogen/starch/alpha-glucan phosphorylase, partial [Clostridiales bacterium]|nr:glycogen/starch/alpha-glucan phosphorylase [Clostridiales bacterium]
MYAIGKNILKTAIEDQLAARYGIKARDATREQMFSVCAILLREMISRNRVLNEKDEGRQLHYLSMEFLMGRSLEKNA